MVSKLCTYLINDWNVVLKIKKSIYLKKNVFETNSQLYLLIRTLVGQFKVILISIFEIHEKR